MYRKIAPGIYRPIQLGEVRTMAEAMNIITALCTPVKQAEVLSALAKPIPHPPKHKKGVKPHHVHFKGVGESILRYQRNA